MLRQICEVWKKRKRLVSRWRLRPCYSWTALGLPQLTNWSSKAELLLQKLVQTSEDLAILLFQSADATLERLRGYGGFRTLRQPDVARHGCRSGEDAWAVFIGLVDPWREEKIKSDETYLSSHDKFLIFHRFVGILAMLTFSKHFDKTFHQNLRDKRRIWQTKCN